MEELQSRPPGSTHRNGRARTRENQARRHAQEAERKVADRREQQSGAARWVADRASEWSLDNPDWGFVERQKYLWNPLMDYWFRMEIEGWEKLPEPPALLIGIHSGAPFVWDAWTVGVQWWRHFGEERPLHGTAHDALMALPGVGAYFRRMGVLPAAPDSIAAALAAGRDVALWPGGERDSLRPWTKRDEAVLAGRTGFVKLAIRSAVPIVPVATVGGPDSMPVLATGRRLAKLLALDRIARLKMFPIAIQVPWGVSPALLPEIPLPTKIRTAFGDPIELDADPERADDDRYVQTKYREVCASIQSGMDALARRRRLPLFG
ncbi:MAG: acyltransferase family protein [Solirubrobacterales bacterium]|nr:acyltransferase family protein [Solirubrobacterales bacterium]